ncbi:MAG: hypothetical protein K1X94_01210 [Sandaracinaceae bacterium]|nr:hypothetical protein [Sandaracinaceae bacterium]
MAALVFSRTLRHVLGLVLVVALVPSLALARAVRRPPPDLGASGDAAVEAEIAPGSGLAAGAPVMVPRPPPPPLTVAEVRATLTQSRGDMMACFPAGAAFRATVQASLSARGGLSLRVRTTPADAAVRQCLDTAARRWLVRLEARPIRRTVSASIQLRTPTQPPPPPTPPTPPGPPSNRYDEGLVHASLDHQRDAILRCLPVASTSTPGDITLRLEVRPDGSMALEGATLPSGVGAGPVLSCLAGIVGSSRVPAPPASRSVTHVVTLGR